MVLIGVNFFLNNQFLANLSEKNIYKDKEVHSIILGLSVIRKPFAIYTIKILQSKPVLGT